MSDRPRIVVIAGPTASGKTALAIELALAIGGELIGADSVQAYRGCDIGSAKPTAEELRGVTHHLLDVANPDVTLDAMDYARLADAAIDDVARRGRLPIVVGGTGLWLRALLRGLVEVPKPDAAIRDRIEAEAATLGGPALHARLRKIDAKAAERIHPNDALRITRALEVFEQTGKQLGELREQHALGEPRFESLALILEPPREVLIERIIARIKTMIAAGFEAEVRRLIERFGSEARVLRSVGYSEMTAFVRGELHSLTDVETAAARSTRAFARRQRNWFRHDFPHAAHPRLVATPGEPDAWSTQSHAAIDRVAQWWAP